MNPLFVFAVACLALVSAQTGTGTSTSTGAGTTSGSTAVNNPTSGPLGQGGLGAGPLGNSLTSPTLPNNPNTARGGINPLLIGAATGMDNLARMALLPSLSRFGPTNQMFFLSGGLDKFFQAYTSDMFNRMLVQSMPGMSPMMAPLLTSQMVDAPDMWAVSNMMFNSRNQQQQPGQMGGASTFPNTNANPFGSLFGGLFGGNQQLTGQGGLPQGAATLTNNMNGGNPFGNMFPFALAMM